MSDEQTETKTDATETAKAPEAKTVHVPAPSTTVPHARLNEVIAQRDAAREKAAANAAKSGESDAAIATLRAELAASKAESLAHKTRGERDLVYAGMSDRPNLAHRDVRDLIEAKYSAYSETADAKPFAEWIAEVAPSSPVLSPYLTTIEAGGKRQPHTPNTGAGGNAGTGGGATLTGADIARARKAGTFGVDAKKAAKDDLRAAGFIK